MRQLGKPALVARHTVRRGRAVREQLHEQRPRDGRRLHWWPDNANAAAGGDHQRCGAQHRCTRAQRTQRVIDGVITATRWRPLQHERAALVGEPENQQRVKQAVQTVRERRARRNGA